MADARAPVAKKKTLEAPLRDLLGRLLAWEDGHVAFDAAVADIPPEMRGKQPEGAPHSPWQLLEHLKRSQRDILEFCRNPDYQEQKWPDDYWPQTPAPPTPSAWDESIKQFRKDRKALQQLAADSRTDLGARIPHGTGQTYLRELLLVADHNAYHLGQLVLVRRLLGILEAEVDFAGGTMATSTTPTPKQQFLASYEREHATTMRVLRAYPTDKLELRPHPRCKTARELAWMFVLERGLGTRLMNNEFAKGVPSGKPPSPPESWQEILGALEKAHKDFGDLVTSTPDDKMLETVKFFTAPKTLGDIPRIDILWFLLGDEIHHRGQFSIYLRMADAKVPSIYGPTADEQWF